MFEKLGGRWARWFWSLPVIALMGGLIFVSFFRSRAANPGTGTISPASQPVMWDGTAVGGTSNGEATCVEGVNCDTFTLTVGGTPADWVGKTFRLLGMKSRGGLFFFLHSREASGEAQRSL